MKKNSRLLYASVLMLAMLFSEGGAGRAWGAVVPPPDLLPLNQIPIPEPPNLFQFIKDKLAAIKLGKAFFWDMQAGSDGIQACASCHFSAGTDNRRTNTINPGADQVFEVRRPGETWIPNDFPFHQRFNPDLQSSPIIRNAQDAVGSQGVTLKNFVTIDPNPAIAADSALPVADRVFNQGADPNNADPANNLRRVTGRNTPSVINAIFNMNNFWDGRAHFMFNGVNPFGPADTTAGIYVNTGTAGAPVLTKQKVSIEFASLASQATGPPLNDTEMSFSGRTFPELGRKLLNRIPLGQQFVHPKDSVLGPHSRATLQPNGKLAGSKGLSVSYLDLIKAAFHDRYWDSGLTVNLPTVSAPAGTPFDQVEANFSFFWGLAIQLYEATLVSDDTPFDRFLGGDQTALTAQQQDGFNLFFGSGRCDLCHAGTELTNASVRAAAFVNNGTHALIEQMPVASGQQIIYDLGYNNTAVTRTADDTGRGATAPFTNPQNGQLFPLSFSLMAELQASGNLPFSAPILPAQLPATFPVAVEGSFKVPGLRNVALTGPYMHNGGMLTLDHVVDFYSRGGNFPVDNRNFLDINISEIGSLQNNATAQTALVRFMESMTDQRVVRESAPFDHPELLIPNGTPGGLQRIPPKDADGNAASAVSVVVNPLTSPTRQASQIISGTMEVGSTVSVSINGGAPVAASTPSATTWSVAAAGLVEGNNTVTISSTDIAVPPVTTTLAMNIVVDTVPPILTVTAPADPIRGGSQTLTGTVEAGIRPAINVNTNASLGGMALNGGSWSCQVSGLSKGTNTFTVTASDAAGNTTSRTVSLTVVLPDGDLGGTGTATVASALKALRIAIGAVQPTAEELLHGDVAPLANGVPAPDGRIDLADALLILKKSVGLINF